MVELIGLAVKYLEEKCKQIITIFKELEIKIFRVTVNTNGSVKARARLEETSRDGKTWKRWVMFGQ